MTKETDMAVASLKKVVELLDSDPEYAKTLGINAQGSAFLHGGAEVLANSADER